MLHISRAGGQLRPSADTKSPESKGLWSWNMHMASALMLMKLWKVAANPKRRRGAWSHASKCCWTNPISSLTGVLLMTFTILTVADQNNAYLFMYASRNHMKCIFQEKKTNRQTSPRHCDIDFLGNVQSSESCIL